MTNIIRHSRARACSITLSQRDGWTTLLIEDDGQGATAADTPATPGNGLRGLAERVSSLGGELQAGPKAGGGYSLRVSLPTDGSRAGSDRVAVDGSVDVERSVTR